MGISDKVVNVTLKANVINLQAVGQLEQVINKAVTATGKVGGVSNTAAAGINKIQGAAVSGNKAINQFGVGTEQASSKLGKFGKIFSDNRGIVFGVAGLTSALAEAVGMMGMFGDSQQRLAEAQDNLNKLEEQGVTSGKAHADAVAEVVKQQRFFNMVSRNTILSQMDMVFFTTMVISGLVKMNTEGGAAAGMLGKLKGMFSGLKGVLSTTTNNFGSFMNAFSPLPATMSKTQQAAAGVSTGITQIGTTSALSMTKVLAFSGALAGIGLAAYGIFLLIQSAEDMKKKFEEVFGELAMQTTLAEAGFLSMKKTMGTATAEELKRLGEVEGAIKLQEDAMKQLGVSVFAFQTNWGGAADKVLALMDEMIKKSPELRESLGIPEAMTDLEAFNSTLEGMRDIQASINPHIEKFKQFWNQVKPPVADAGKLIKGFVAGLALAPPLAEELEDDLNAWIAEITKSDKELEKVLTAAEKLKALSDTEEGKGIMADFLGSPEVAAGSWAERIGNMEGAVAQITGIARQKFDEFNTYVESGGRLTAEQWISTWAGTTPEIKSVFMDMVNDAANAVDGFKEVMADLQEQTSQNTAAYLALRSETSKWFDVSKISTAQMGAANEMFKNTFGSIIDQSQAIKDNEAAWNALKDSSIQFIDQKLNEVAVWAATNDMLAENLEWQFKVKDAYVQGMVSAKEWTEQTALAAVEAQGFRANLIGLNATLFQGVNTYDMLTSELQDYITFAMGGRDATIELQRASEEARDSMVESFSSLFDTEKFSDFKKEFKELDLRKVFGKEGAGDFKDMFADLRESAQDIEVLQTAMNALGVAVQDIDRMSGKDLAQNFDSFAESYKKTIVEAGLGNKTIDDMIAKWEKLSGTELRQQLNEIPQTWMMINEAIKTNGISTQEAAAIDIMRKKETGEINKLNKDQIKIINDAGFAYDEATGKITKVTDAMNHYNSEMSKVEVTGIAVQTIAKMWADLAKAIINANTILHENWSETVLFIAEETSILIVEMAKAWAALVKSLMSMNETTASHWSKMCNSMMKNASAAGNGIRNNLEKAMDDVEDRMSDLASHWSKMCNSMIKNAKSAANGINKALDGIKDQEVKINYVETGAVPNAKGGVYSFEQGGVVSAARGLYTTNGLARFGPFQYGDNSGGRETIAFLPHDGNKADNIMDQLDVMFGRKRNMTIVGGGGDRDIIVPITININGEQYSFTRKYRVKQGQEIASQVV